MKCAPNGYNELEDPIIITVTSANITATMGGVDIMDPNVATETDENDVIIRYIYSMKVEQERNGEPIPPAPTGYKLGAFGIIAIIILFIAILAVLRRRTQN